MLWTLLLVGLSIFVFSVIGAEVLARPALIDRPEDFSDMYREIVQKNFFSIQSTMLGLVRTMTLDSIYAIYIPLILEGDYSILIYFISALLVLAVLLMNLVTAVIVEQAVDQGNREREVKLAFERSRRKRVIRAVLMTLRRRGGGGWGEYGK